nr:tail fiber domain-containing protein [Ardenticatenia bacterium]
GIFNPAAGDYSLAAGRRAKANNQGCFVWGDSTDADVICSNDNRWVARASGGVYFYTNSGLTSGMYLSAGGSAWNAVSDRERKENFGPVDAQELLARLAENPITTWNYKSQDPAIRHIGPMAQDFNALIDGLGGEGEDYINTLDADGVALAAIQGLYQLSQEQATRIEELETENAALQQQMDSLETRVAALEAGRCPEPVEGSPQSVQAGAFDGAQTKFLPGAGILLASLALGLLIRRGGVLRL